MSKFYLAHGELHKLETFNLHGIESYRNALYIREDIRLYNTKALFLEEHIQRITDTLNAYSIAIPTNFDIEHIQRYITRLLNVNKVYKGGVCSIYILPQDNKKSWYCALFIESIENTEFTFNSNGWHLNIDSTCMRTQPHTPCECSWHKAWLFTAHRIQTQNEIESIGVVNEHGEIVGTSRGDILACNDNHIHIISAFPSPLTKQIAAALSSHGYSLTFHETIAHNTLLSSDEIAIVDTIQGLRWISNIDENVYGCIQLKKMWHVVIKHIHA